MRRQRDVLDAEIAAVESGASTSLDSAAVLDRYQHFSSTARELLADFREVEGNFRRLDRDARAKITAWDGPKGDLLGELVGDRQTIAASDQGRSFQAFYDFLLSPERHQELDALLRTVAELPARPADRRLRYVHHDWFDAAERTQQMVRQLSEQPRRVVELLRNIERTAVTVRPQADVRSFIELDAVSPQVILPFERPLYEPAAAMALDSVPTEEGVDDLERADELALHAKAVTLAGQIRSSDARHEKDDRFRIDDRTRWVLGCGLYLRQIDVPCVDTKFIAAQRDVLAALLDLLLPGDAVDDRHSRATGFAFRYGFAEPAPLVRMRVGDGFADPAGVSDIGMRLEQERISWSYSLAALTAAGVV